MMEFPETYVLYVNLVELSVIYKQRFKNSPFFTYTKKVAIFDHFLTVYSDDINSTHRSRQGIHSAVLKSVFGVSPCFQCSVIGAQNRDI